MKLITKKSVVSLFLAITMLFAFTGFTQAQQYGVIDDIPDEANRIVLEQEGVPPADLYVDTYNTLRTMDFNVTSSEGTLELNSLRDILNNDEPLAFSAKKQVEDNLALWLTFNVETAPGGGKLIASAKYAEDVNAPVTEWNQATWTDGKAEEAFIEALDVIRHTRYDAMDFEVGVALATE